MTDTAATTDYAQYAADHYLDYEWCSEENRSECGSCLTQMRNIDAMIAADEACVSETGDDDDEAFVTYTYDGSVYPGPVSELLAERDEILSRATSLTQSAIQALSTSLKLVLEKEQLRRENLDLQATLESNAAFIEAQSELIESLQGEIDALEDANGSLTMECDYKDQFFEGLLVAAVTGKAK